MLRYVTSTLTACALAGSVSVLAQEPAPAPPAQQAEAPQTPKEILTGCVVQARTTDGGTAYLLNDAEGGSTRTYVLAESAQPGPSESDWADNVNKKIEVTGPVTQPGGPPASESAGNQKVLRPPLVQVEAVKVVAESCK